MCVHHTCKCTQVPSTQGENQQENLQWSSEQRWQHASNNHLRAKLLATYNALFEDDDFRDGDFEIKTAIHSTEDMNDEQSAARLQQIALSIVWDPESLKLPNANEK